LPDGRLICAARLPSRALLTLSLTLSLSLSLSCRFRIRPIRATSTGRMSINLTVRTPLFTLALARSTRKCRCLQGQADHTCSAVQCSEAHMHYCGIMRLSDHSFVRLYCRLSRHCLLPLTTHCSTDRDRNDIDVHRPSVKSHASAPFTRSPACQPSVGSVRR